MRFKPLFLALAVFVAMTQTVAAQPYDPYGRRYYDDGYRRPPPPPGYYEDRRYRERPPEVYRQGPQRVFCAREDGFCHFQGPATVYYGAGGRFASRRAVNGIPCSNSVFGDPFPGADKSCFFVQGGY